VRQIPASASRAKPVPERPPLSRVPQSQGEDGRRSESDMVAPLQLMTAQQVSELLNGIPASTVHAWARSGYLPSVKIGRHRRFVRDDVLDFIDRQRPLR
jgi:excisionase family DNA binding protein